MWNAVETQNLADLEPEVWLMWGQNDLCEARDQKQTPVWNWHFCGHGSKLEKLKLRNTAEDCELHIASWESPTSSYMAD